MSILPTDKHEQMPPRLEYSTDQIPHALERQEPFTGDYGVELREKGSDMAVHVGDEIHGVAVSIRNRKYPDIETESYQLHGSSETKGKSGQIFSGYIPGMGDGDIYCLTVLREETVVENGHPTNKIIRHNNVLDPYALATTQPIENLDGEAHQYSCVVDPSIIIPSSPLHLDPDLRVIGEVHPKGYTNQHPEVPEEHRGKLPGLVDPEVIEHIKYMGITSVEIMPVHKFSTNEYTKNLNNRFNYDAKLSNFFGYGSDSWLALNNNYATGDTPDAPLREFNEMVKRFHEADLEVIVDVVFNHTGENNSLEILDQKSYYMFNNGKPVNYNGCAQSIDAYNEHSVHLMIRSLELMADMGVDGFRFDLMGALAKDKDGRYSVGEHPLFKAIRDSPKLSKLKMIGEPWTGTSGYAQTAPGDAFVDHGIHTWWGKSRDFYRDLFIRHKNASLKELKYYMDGSFNEEEANRNRKPNIINFLTAHDGPRGRDLVSYNGKWNQANGENNNDGTDDYRSYNHGYEGVTTEEMRAVPYFQDLERRRRASLASAMAAIALSNGIPMFYLNDETKTAWGNNNHWNQDNETSYINWKVDPELAISTNALRTAIAIRRANRGLNRSLNEMNTSTTDSMPKNVEWFKANGQIMTERDFDNDHLAGRYVQGKNGDDIITYVNTGGVAKNATLPQVDGYKGLFAEVFNPQDESYNPSNEEPIMGEVTVPPHSMVVVRRLRLADKASVSLAA